MLQVPIVFAVVSILLLGILSSAWAQTEGRKPVDHPRVTFNDARANWNSEFDLPFDEPIPTQDDLTVAPLGSTSVGSSAASKIWLVPNSAVVAGALIQPTKNIHPSELPQEGVQWQSLVRHSFFFNGTMHAFRIATEPATRAALHNSVASGYFKAVGAMHGWSDGDGYYENYLGHPIQGAVSGYIWIHNDPRYLSVEFGGNRDYWMSRLRAYAYSWAFSEQFEVGLLSEASIGQIQRHCCAYGFVDHVITPNGGLAWIVAEDVVDKYVVRKIEDRTSNTAIRILARTGLNPPLTFANLMASRAPWHRDSRAGVLRYKGEGYPRPVASNSGSFEHPIVPQFEMSASLPFIMRIGSLSCLGGGGIGGFHLAPSLQWTVEVGGCALTNLPKHWSGDSLIFSTGPQWIQHLRSRWTPRVHFRVGGQKIVEEYSDPVLKKKVLSTLSPTKDPHSVYYDYTTHYETTGLSLSAGGGMDLRLNKALAVRIGSVEYTRSWLGRLNGADFTNGVRFSTGLVLRIGTW